MKSLKIYNQVLTIKHNNISIKGEKACYWLEAFNSWHAVI